MIIYEGKSKANNKPILAILTEKTRNRKTGPVGQLWILPKNIKP